MAGTLRDPPKYHVVNFGVQVKAGQCRLARRSLERLIQGLDERPVMVLAVEIRSVEAQAYAFCMLHDWLLRHPDWPNLIDGRGEFVRLGAQDFTSVASDGSNLREALLREYGRVTPGSALWRSSRSRMLPVSESDLYRNFGRLPRFEIPIAVRREVSALEVVPTQEEQWEYLRSLWVETSRTSESLPATQQWLEEVRKPIAPGEVVRERAEFMRFVTAMKQYAECPDYVDRGLLPTYTWSRISSWRVFLQVFPQAFGMIRHMLRSLEGLPRDQLVSGLVLAATVANVEDQGLRETAEGALRARALERLLRVQTVSSYEEYRVVANYYDACAEAGIPGEEDVCLEFIKRNASGQRVEWDLRLMREYYQGDDARSLRAVEVKVRSPNVRNLNTTALDIARLEKLRRATKT